MGLYPKILGFIAALVIALVVVTAWATSIQADRLARSTIDQMLSETQEVWESLQADRYRQLKLGVRVLANDAFFKAAVETGDEPTVADMLQERGRDLGSDVLIATDWDGYVVARSDRTGAQGQDLSGEPVVLEALEGAEPATVWKEDGHFFHTVSVPMTLRGEIIGTLVAGYGIDAALAANIRKLTRSDVAYLDQPPDGPPRVVVSSLGSADQEALARLLEREAMPATDGEPFELDLPNDPSIAVLAPLTALSGERVGSVLARRSLREETASFRSFRNSMIVVSLVVMVLALAAGHFGSRKITDPVRKLAGMVERARDGSYTGAVTVHTGDEIGGLARAFNGLLTELREKEQMIEFLREGLTLAGKKKAEQESGPTAAVTVVAGSDTDPGGHTPGGSPAPSAGGGASTPNAMRLERGSVFAGRYEIAGTLGKGGMAVVYKARDRQLDEDVALKLLRPEVVANDKTLVDRFKLELKLARRITHRNVLRTHDFSETDGIPYISMEYVDGGTLKQLVKNRGALPTGVGLRVAKQICLGLEAAHAQGVVHRDIKPQNILIIPETGEVKVMDFGIARVSEVRGGEDAGLTSAGTVMGTPDYMPPEQAQGHQADFRSDIYSLGMVLYEILVGKLPFSGDTAMAIVLHHIRTPPPPPRQINPDLPESLEAVVLRCIEKDPARRYQTVLELRRELTALSNRSEAAA